MDILDLVKDSTVFNGVLINVIGALMLSAVSRLISPTKFLFYPLLFVFKNDLSSCFNKLSVEDKSSALLLIFECKEADVHYNILIKEIKLQKYGLVYPIPVLKVLFDYVYMKNIDISGASFLSFLSCNQIFDYDRNKMPVWSLKKLIAHIVVYTLFLAFLTWYMYSIYNGVVSLAHAAVTVSNLLNLFLMVVNIFISIRIFYIFAKQFIYFFFAISFSKEMERYILLKDEEELIRDFKL